MIAPYIRAADGCIELCLVELLDPITGSSKLHVRKIDAMQALSLAEGLLREANRLLADKQGRANYRYNPGGYDQKAADAFFRKQD